MHSNELPPINECSSSFSEEEAFDHAELLYDRAIEQSISEPTKQLLDGLDYAVFRKAVVLQLAGLSLLGTKELDDDDAFPIAFAAFAVDHLLWGMSAAANGQVRVAFTLVRGAVEAAIFDVAAATDLKTFRNKWSTREGTGGAILRSLQALDPRMKFFLEMTWKHIVEFGHASRVPVLSAVGRARSGSDVKKTISFAGQYAGPLDAKLLRNIFNAYCLAAISCVKVMNIAVIPHIREQQLWRSRYAALDQLLNAEVEVPRHLAAYVKSEFGQTVRKGLRGSD